MKLRKRWVKLKEKRKVFDHPYMTRSKSRLSVRSREERASTSSYDDDYHLLHEAGAAAMKMSGTSAMEWVSKRRQAVQPWSQFLSTSRFGKPTSIATAGSRVVKNIEHFQSNYLFVFIILAIYCILTSPMLLIFLGLIFGACYWIKVKNQSKKLKIGNYELTLAQQYGAVGLCSFPLFFLAGASSAIFWVIGASFFFIMLHAVFYNPIEPLEEIQMDEVSFGSA